jgi:hypothetical protein
MFRHRQIRDLKSLLLFFSQNHWNRLKKATRIKIEINEDVKRDCPPSTLFFKPLHMFLQNLLNLLVQSANEIGLLKEDLCSLRGPSAVHMKQQ